MAAIKITNVTANTYKVELVQWSEIRGSWIVVRGGQLELTGSQKDAVVAQQQGKGHELWAEKAPCSTHHYNVPIHLMGRKFHTCRDCGHTEDL
jgi:hypothetical protein